MTEPRIIYVGKKPVHSYVRAVWMVMQEGHRDIELIARGGAIKTCVDVAEICRRRSGIIASRLPEDTAILSITSDTEEVPREDSDRPGSASVIKIRLAGHGAVQDEPPRDDAPAAEAASTPVADTPAEDTAAESASASEE